MTWLLATAFAAQAFMLPGLADPYQTPRLVVLAALCIPLLLRQSERQCAMDGAAYRMLCVWVICCGLSRDMAYSLVGSYLSPFDGLATVAVYVGLLVGVARLGASVEDAAEAICWTSLPLSLYALAQGLIGNADPLLPAPLPSLRVVAMQGSPVYLGAVLAIVSACAAALLSGPRRRVAAVALGLAIPALWLTQTRGALLAAGAGMLFLLPARARLAALAALPLIALHPRLQSAAADAGRIEVWKAAWAMFRESPWLGLGPGTFEMAFRAHITPGFLAAHRNAFIIQAHAHNIFLQILATAGVLGALGAAGLAYSAWRTARECSAPAWRVIAAASIAFLVVAQVNPVPHSAFALMAVLFGCASSRPALSRAWSGEVAYAGACATSLFLAFGIARGDWHYARAVRAQKAGQAVEVANELAYAAKYNPWDMQFVARRIDAAVRLAPVMTAKDREMLATSCLAWARTALNNHPNDSWAHEVMGRSLLVAIASGLPEDPRSAMEAFKAAQALAPTFPPLMSRRRSLALALGDAREAMEAEQDLAKVSRLVEGRTWL